MLFANFAEAIAEGRGKAQADALSSATQRSAAKNCDVPQCGFPHIHLVSATALRKGDVVLVEAGDLIPGRRAR